MPGRDRDDSAVGVTIPGLTEATTVPALDPALTRSRVWSHLRRDRGVVAAAVFLALLLLAVLVGGPLLSRLLGHGPDDIFTAAVDELLRPVGPWARVPDPNGGEALLPLGADGPLGRDELLRLLDGGRVSLAVAVGGTLVAVTIGVVLGTAAAYFGGWLDAFISRLTELVMAFPLLFFVILLASTVRDDLSGITLGVFAEGVVALVLLIGAFTWFYPARVIRTEVLSLREQPFVEAARMLGAGDLRIMRYHVLPHLAAPILVLSALMVPVNILLEAGVGFLGLGIELPTASWGSLLATAWGTVRQPTTTSQSMTLWITLFPSVAILVTVLAFNVLGEGLRAALDPRSRPRA